MKVCTITLIVILTTSLALSNEFCSQKYFSLSAEDKLDQLWTEITKDTTKSDWYSSLDMATLFIEDLNPTFDDACDTIREGRKKLIHTVGTIAKAEFIPKQGHPYSGNLQTGSKNMFLRLSTAHAYDTTKSTAEGAYENFAPGLSIKFLIDGKPSTNVVALYSTGGQASWNFFLNDITPQFDINYDGASTGETLVAAKFSTLTNYISTLANSEMCSITPDGNQVPADKVKVPFKIFFRAPDAMKDLFEDNFTTEYTDIVSKIPTGTTVYEVYAIERPDCLENLIGEIVIRSPFTTSKFADLSMFFKHARNDFDFAIHEDWKIYRDYWSIFTKTPGKKVPKQECPFKSLLGLF
jgi:hypothetical protein